MKNTIICLKGEADSGKTHIVKCVYEKLFEETYKKREINGVFLRKDNVSIALISQGDPGINVYLRIKKKIKLDAKIILCCARTGEANTKDDVFNNNFIQVTKNESITSQYEIIYFETKKYNKTDICLIQQQYEELSYAIAQEVENRISL